MTKLKLPIALAAAIFLSCLAGRAPAQTYPDHPIRIIAPFPAGGLVDVLARAVGDELSKTMGQAIIVENKPGAGGNLGADLVAKAAPDGYALLMTSPGIQSINQFLYKSMPFDAETAFVPISLVADMPMQPLVDKAPVYERPWTPTPPRPDIDPATLSFSKNPLADLDRLFLRGR